MPATILSSLILLKTPKFLIFIFMSEFKFSLFNRPELINSKNIDSSSKDLRKSSKFKLISKFDVKGLNFILPLKYYLYSNCIWEKF